VWKGFGRVRDLFRLVTAGTVRGGKCFALVVHVQVLDAREPVRDERAQEVRQLVGQCVTPSSGSQQALSLAVASMRVSGLEQLDQVASRIGDQDLASAGSRDDLAAKGDSSGTEPVDLAVEVVEDQVDAIPARPRVGGGCSTSTGAGRAGEQEPQRSADDVGEGVTSAAPQRESQVSGVEVNSRVDVVHDVADADELIFSH